MTDALFPLSAVPGDESYVLGWVLGREWFKGARYDILCRYGVRGFRPGYLPLPDDASSASVAKCAAEWLEVCADQHAAEVVRALLRREGVRRAVKANIDEARD